MSAFDWVVVALVALLAYRGFRAGFVSGAFSLVGLGIGAYLGLRLAALLLRFDQDLAGYAPIVFPAGALLFAVLGGFFARSVGGRIGNSIRRVPGLGPLDGLAGAALGAAVGLLVAWAVGTLLLQGPVPPSARQSAERSELLSAIGEHVPSGTLPEAIAGLGSMPRIEGPRPEVAEPTLPDRGVQGAARSVVQVVATGGRGDGQGYGYASTGSGWVAAPELVVTNAHVVAGSDRIAVRQEGAWRGYEADVVSVDAGDDVAVLAVDGLDLPVLRSTDPEPGEPVAIVGYPYGGPLDAQPGRVGTTSRAYTADARGGQPVGRYVTSIRGEANPGNSGGPAINREGEVVGTVFASAGYADVAYAIPPAVVAEQLDTAERRVASVSGDPPGKNLIADPVTDEGRTAA